MDLPMGEDLYESFIQYQERVIKELDALSSEYHFYSVDATRPIDENSEALCAHVSTLLQSGGRSGRRRAVPG
jgi:thymidylate kinase